jgi:hypothetical protein
MANGDSDRPSPPDDARRAFLVRALASGVFAAAFPQALRAQILGTVPRELPAGQSIYSLRGDVRVNGARADRRTLVRSGDVIETGRRAEAIFAVDKDAYLLRADSRLAFGSDSALASIVRLATGAVLAVFGASEHRIVTANATIGIRGTGMYVEARPDRSYVCACYGTVDIAAVNSRERASVVSRHHDSPRYVYASGESRIGPAPVLNHTDQELALIEALVGRTPPFALFDDSYGRQNRY